MVKKHDKAKNYIKADVIILGCSLPGIVTAHKLKKRFGNTLDIMVLDLATTTLTGMSKCNVVFQEEGEEAVIDKCKDVVPIGTVMDNVAKHYILKYARDFNIPVPECIINPKKKTCVLRKVFQCHGGKKKIVEYNSDYHDFDYLNVLEKFELNQYQNKLDHQMKDLFQGTNPSSYIAKRKLRYYDQTTMEKHICQSVLFPTPRAIMRNTVKLVCGANPEDISVLFYLHQCYRTRSCKNHIDGNNTRFREKLLGHCRKLISNKLQKSIADITMTVQAIKYIRSYPNEQVILETVLGTHSYVCNLLAMAVNPEQLNKIKVESQFLSEAEYAIATAMMPGRLKKFVIQYSDNFWIKEGYSGDIVSAHGPILWAMERPKYKTSDNNRSATLIGYLGVLEDGNEESSEMAVVEQLVKLFGEEAAQPMQYKESEIADVYVPRCGDYVGLRGLIAKETMKNLEWGALDVFADGDVAAAIEAGHMTFVRLMSTLRPQAETFEDGSKSAWPTVFEGSPLRKWFSHINVASTMRMIVYTTVAYASVKIARKVFQGFSRS